MSAPSPIVAADGTVWTPILLGGEWLYRTAGYCVVYTREQVVERFGTAEVDA